MTKLVVDLQPVEAKALFLEKKYNPEEGFFRAPEENVFWIGSNGDNILMSDKSNRIVPELATYRADFVNEAGEELGVNHEALETALRERMEALLDCFTLYPAEHPRVKPEEFEAFLLDHFKEEKGRVRVYDPRPQLNAKPDELKLHLGVLDHAGYVIRAEGYPLRAAMLAFGGRVKAVYVG
jgi:hypothetical protein